MDLLRRHQAPIANVSWAAIDEQAREVLTANMSARKIVDVSGPHGIEHAAVNLGRLDPGRVDAGGGVLYGIRKLLPLCEVRVPFTLDLWELDNVVRGARDPDLDPLIEAAGKLAASKSAPSTTASRRPASSACRARRCTSLAAGHVGDHLARDDRARDGAAQARGRTAALRARRGRRDVPGPREPRRPVPAAQQIEALIEGQITLAPFIDGAFLLPIDNSGDFELSARAGRRGRLRRAARSTGEALSHRIVHVPRARPQAVVVFTMAS